MFSTCFFPFTKQMQLIDVCRLQFSNFMIYYVGTYVHVIGACANNNITDRYQQYFFQLERGYNVIMNFKWKNEYNENEL